jgi:putative transposase
MLHAVTRFTLLCPSYCLMPDHAHILWMGVAESADQRNAMKFFRTNTTPFLKPYVWQRQPFDHVLRETEREHGAFAATSDYILRNPARKGLVSDPAEWPFSGAIVPGYPRLAPGRNEFWELFWRIYGERVSGRTNSSAGALP